MAVSFEFTPPMVVDTVYPWLEKYANKTETSHNVLQNVQFELELVGVIYEEDRWLDVLDFIERGPEGWDDVRAAWQKAKTSGM